MTILEEHEKVSQKRKKTQKEYYRKNTEKYYGYYKAFVEKVKSQGGNIRDKYIEAQKRAERNYDYKRNTLLYVKYLFGNTKLI